jgi:hypothetical protein
MAENEIIDLEQGPDGVYKPATVRKVRKKKESEDIVDIVPSELRQSPDNKVTELIRGFDVGMQIFNRLSKAIREGK